MSSGLGIGAAVAQATANSVSIVPCRVMQVTPLLVSFDGGSSSTPGTKLAGLTYSTGLANNALALMSPGSLVVLPIG